MACKYTWSDKLMYHAARKHAVFLSITKLYELFLHLGTEWYTVDTYSSSSWHRMCVLLWSSPPTTYSVRPDSLWRSHKHYQGTWWQTDCEREQTENEPPKIIEVRTAVKQVEGQRTEYEWRNKTRQTRKYERTKKSPKKSKKKMYVRTYVPGGW